MTRLAGIAMLYAVIAALVLVTPLSASQEPPTDAVPAETAVPPEAGSPGTTPGAAPPEAAPEGAAPPEAAPEGAAPPEAALRSPDSNAAPQPTAPAPAAPAPGQPASGESAPAAAPAPEQAAAAVPAADDGAVAAPADRKRRRSGRAPQATAAADTTVTIRDFQFAPASVTIDVGDTVTWNNDGPTAHSATADDGEFDTGIFDAGQSRSHTFDQAGTFSYFCTPHPNMQGTVTVRAASSGDDTGGGAGDTGGEAGDESGGTDSGAAESDTDTSDDSSGAALPATGRDTGGLAVLGLMTLALGVWLRRRAGSAG